MTRWLGQVRNHTQSRPEAFGRVRIFLGQVMLGSATLAPGRPDSCVHPVARSCSVPSAQIHARPRQLRFPCSHPNRPLQIHCPRYSDDSPSPLPHRRGARLFQATRKTRPASSTTTPRSLCLLPTSATAPCASSTTRRWPRLGPARPHGHQRRRSALAT